MKAINLYNQLEKDFVRPGMSEDWYAFGMPEADEIICDNFKQRSMGLLCDFAEEINSVYTAVFPSDKVLKRILDDGAADAMVFLHHPLIWDLGKDPNKIFYEMNVNLLKKLKERRVSLFNFHYPLDNFGEYSTTKTLADALGITVIEPFAEFSGALCGIIGKTDCKDVDELNAKYTKAVGHETRIYQYGSKEIVDGIVALCAGGGNDVGIVEELVKRGINVLVSGISVKNDFSADVHELERKNGINLLGGTHYSSEKFACIAMCGYFNKLGLAAEFIDDVPCLYDM